MGTGAPSWGKWPGSETDHSPPTSAEVKKMWICNLNVMHPVATSVDTVMSSLFEFNYSCVDGYLLI
jgi:hypothetical protein